MVDIVTRAGKGSPLTNNEVDANFTNLAEVSGITGEPMGHEDRTTSTISFNASTRTFTIAPVSTSFTVWCKGKKVVVSSAQTVTIPNTSGMYSIYYDANGVLAAKAGYFTFSVEAPTAYVYWNAATGTCPYFGDERHGVVLDWQTHEYLHRTRGAALASGFGASGYTLGGNGSSNAHAQLTLEGGTFFDEDMKIIVTATNTPTAGTWEQDLLSPARIPVLYLSGTGWVIDAPTDYPLKQGTARPQYNALSGGVWSTADVANNKYATSWILATNNLTYPVIAIIGQAESDLQSAAEAVDFTSLQLPGFPSVEFRPLYRLVFQCADSFSNAVKASLVSITDIRSIAAAGVAASLITDHGNLSGLSDDDHPQYLSVDTVRGTLTAAVKASFLPSQTDNAGKFLTTDATSTSWAALTSGNITTALGFTPYNATNPAGYITGITSSNVTTALGFTPYNATNPSGFVTAAGARGAISVTGAGSYDSATGVINIVGGVTSFNTRTGAITLSSGDVTGALGFTPYNSSNPSGYITGITSGMVTTALGFTPYNSSNPSGYITSSALSGYLTSASAASTYLPLAGGTITGSIIAANNNVGGVFGNLEIGYGGRYNTLQTKTNADTLWLQYGHSGPIGIGYGGGDTTFYGKALFQGAVNSRPQMPNGFLGLDTGDGNFDIWGISREYYPSNPTAANAWGIRWDGDGNQIRFIGGGNVRVSFDLDDGTTQINGNTVLHGANYNSYAPTLTGTGASGTWGISISGNAATATTATSTPLVSVDNSLVFGRSGLQYVNISNAAGDVASTTNTPTTDWWHIIRGNHGNSGGYYTDLALPMTAATNIRYRRISNGGSSGWITVLDGTNYSSYALPLSGGTLSGNVTLNTADGEILVTPTGWRASDRAAIKIRSKANAPAEIDLRHTVGGVESGWHISARDTSSSSELHLYKFNMNSSGAADSSSFVQMFTFTPSGGFNAVGALTQNGNQVLHAGNYGSYALPLSGGTLSGTLRFGDSTNGLYLSGGRLTVRSESADGVANFASYGLYLPVLGQTAGLYVESPIEARGGLRMGSGAGSGTITVGADTSATANRLVQRDAGGHITGNYILGAYFNASAGNSENPTIGQVWTQSTGDNYLRKSTPAHFISQLGLITTSNYSSYALPLSGGTVSGVITSSISNGTVMNMAGQSDSFGYNGTAGLGTYIKGTSATYIYGGGKFWDGSTAHTLLHAGNYTSYSPSLGGSGASGTWSINVTGDAGSASILRSSDVRTISPSSHSAGRLTFGFTSWNNNNTSDWADYLHLRSYTDASGQADNLVTFRKNGIGMRIWQQSWGSGTAYSSSVDVLHSSNYSSYALPLSGGTLTGALSATSGLRSYYSDHIPGDGYGIRFWESNSYKISMGASSLYQYGTVTDYSIKMQMDNGSPGRGFTWGRESFAPVAALNGTTGSFQTVGAVKSGNNMSRPNASWGSSGATGMAIFKLPGGSGNYGMVHMVFDIYEYNGNTVSTVIVGGHNWASSWYNIGANVIGQCGKQVRLGFIDGQYCVVFGDGSSYWEYGQVVLRKIQNGEYYNNIMDLGAAFSVVFTASASFSNISGDLRALRTPASFNAGGAITQAGNQVLHAGNYTSYSPSLGGSGASGTWGISISGSAGSLQGYEWFSYGKNIRGVDIYADSWLRNYNSGTGLYNQETANHWYSDGQYWNVGMTGSVRGVRLRNGHAGSILGYLYAEDNANFGLLHNGGGWSVQIYNGGNGYLHGTWNGGNIRANRANGWFYIDDNYGVGVVGAYSSYRYQTVYAMGDSYKMSSDGTSLSNMYGIAWSHPNAGGAAGNLTDHGMLIITAGSFKCAISNSIVASGNITAYSDERLKTNWRDMPEDYVTRLAEVKVGIYDRIDEKEMSQVGVSAQSFQKLLPQAIMTAKDEMQTLSVNYGSAALASAVELAKRVVDQEKRIAHLESLISKLIGD